MGSVKGEFFQCVWLIVLIVTCNRVLGVSHDIKQEVSLTSVLEVTVRTWRQRSELRGNFDCVKLRTPAEHSDPIKMTYSPRLLQRIRLLCLRLTGELRVAGICYIPPSLGDGRVKTSAWVNTTGQAIYIYNLEIWAAGEGLVRTKVVGLREKMAPETIFASNCWHGDIINFADYYEIVPEDGLALKVTVSGYLEEAQVVILYSTDRPAAGHHRSTETSESLLFGHN